ncbi:MAG: tryptophan--tRNA ligase [Firmicutes bacterium]|nr:tryptophan--tRNA ligase [Bacillota bacterium]
MTERVFSGIQPTGVVHIGNYLGAIKNWVNLQNEYESFFCIVDYHALTVPYEPKELPERVLELGATLLASGLDPEKCTLFVQSDVPEHTELTWLLTCITPVGQLSRMTQFKDKSQGQAADSIGAGLLCYPILMAADILIYKANRVPVGEDQTQHLELTRDIARRFNNIYGETFPEVQGLFTKTARIMALNDPEKKMSKSIPGSYIALTEDEASIRKKIRRAVTATGADPNTIPPGVANLFALLEAFGGEEDAARFREDYQAGTIRYSDLKEAVAEHMLAELNPIRQRYHEIIADREGLKKILARGGEAARTIARQNLHEIREKVGLVYQ